MNIHNAIDKARQYLFRSLVDLDRDKFKESIVNYRLDSNLQYHLCQSFSRLETVWEADNICDKDIHMLVESWLMAQGAMGCLPRGIDGNLYYSKPGLIHISKLKGM